MSDAISRKGLLDVLAWLSETVDASNRETVRDMIFRVCNAPGLDVEPVVHARWEPSSKLESYHTCANCGLEHPLLDLFYFGVASDYRPRCGARMDGGDA